MSGAWQEYERSRERSSRAGAWFAVAGIAAFAVLVFQHFFVRDAGNSDAVATVESGEATRSELVDFPGMSSVENPSSAVTVAPSQRTYGRDGTAYVGIYECTVNGQRVVSDRPCGAGATARVIEVAPARAPPSSPVPQYRPTPPSVGKSTARSDSGSANASFDNTSACAAVDRAIDDLNSRMRQPYTSQEGEWLRAEWHRLKQRRHDLRCGR